MGCRTESKMIGEREYSVTQWPATRSMLFKMKLIKTFGATLAIIVGQSSDSKNKPNDDAKALSKGLSVLFETNSPEDVVTLMKDSIIGVACNGTKITSSSFDELFSGDDLLEVYKVFIFILQVNYSNLMKGQLGDRLLTKLKESL